MRAHAAAHAKRYESEERASGELVGDGVLQGGGASGELVSDGVLQGGELRRPLVERGVLLGVGCLVGQVQQRADLVDVAVHVPVENQRDQELLHLLGGSFVFEFCVCVLLLSYVFEFCV